MLRVAARHADIVGLTGFSHVEGVSKLTHFTATRLLERIELIHSFDRQRAQPLRFQALVQLVRVTDDRRSATEELLKDWGSALTLDEALASPFLLIGTAAEIADQIRGRSERFGIETWTVFAGRPIDATLDELATVAAELAA